MRWLEAYVLLCPSCTIERTGFAIVVMLFMLMLLLLLLLLLLLFLLLYCHDINSSDDNFTLKWKNLELVFLLWIWNKSIVHTWILLLQNVRRRHCYGHLLLLLLLPNICHLLVIQEFEICFTTFRDKLALHSLSASRTFCFFIENFVRTIETVRRRFFILAEIIGWG